MKRITVMLVVFSFVLLGVAAQAQEAVTTRTSPPDPSQVRLTEVASGFDRPLYITHSGDGTGRLFVLEQSGGIHILQDGQRMDTPFLDVSRLISQDVFQGRYTERGLLGIAFHPDFETNGIFFLNYTDLNGASVVARYTISADDPNIADPDSAEILLTQSQPFSNHNGGHLDFGPDGYLYISLGDGGSAGDPQNHGQSPDTLLGTILRLDVDSATPYGIPDDNPYVNNPALAPEVWAWGLRNVWRFSFDRATGDLYMGDVGQNQWEEINFQPADSPGGENYGWNFFEGTTVYAGGGNPDDFVMPIAEYRHTNGISVTGGYVYRGEGIPTLQGAYIYGDFGFGTVWTVYRDENNQWQNDVLFPPTGYTISSFGEDEAGELYLVNYNGNILRFDPR